MREIGEALADAAGLLKDDPRVGPSVVACVTAAVFDVDDAITVYVGIGLELDGIPDANLKRMRDEIADAIAKGLGATKLATVDSTPRGNT